MSVRRLFNLKRKSGSGSLSGKKSKRPGQYNALLHGEDTSHPHSALVLEIVRDMQLRLSDATLLLNADEVKEVAIRLVVALETFRPRGDVRGNSFSGGASGAASMAVTGRRSAGITNRVMPAPRANPATGFDDGMESMHGRSKYKYNTIALTFTHSLFHHRTVAWRASRNGTTARL